MIAPAVAEHRCVWSGHVCVTRRTLRGAVESWTKAAQNARTTESREVAVRNRQRCLRELSAHSCGPVGGASGCGDIPRAPYGGTPAEPATTPSPRTPHDSAVTRLDVETAHAASVRAAQRMTALRGGNPAEHEAALDAFIAADRAFRETLYALPVRARMQPPGGLDETV